MNIRRKILLLLLLLGILGASILFWRGNLMPRGHQAEKPAASEGIAVLKAESRDTDHDSSLPTIESDFRHLFHVEAFNYEGPQTVEGLLEMFQEMAADAVLDEKYPQEEWIERVLAQGYTIESWEDYAGFLTARQNLIGLESRPEVWASGRLGISPTNDFETYKEAYMDRKIWEYGKLKDAKLADPQVNGGFFKDRTFLPFAPQRVYIERVGTGAVFMGTSLSDTQKFELLTQDVTPEGYEVIYINNEGTRLADPPPLLAREELGVNSSTLSPNQSWDAAVPQDDFSFNTNAHEPDASAQRYDAFADDAAARALETEKQAYNAVVDRLRTLDAMGAGEYEGLTGDPYIDAELQKFFTAEGSAKNGMDPEIHGGFSPERLDRAMNTLKRYGPKEGIERIRAEDPNIAAQIENSMRFNSSLGKLGSVEKE